MKTLSKHIKNSLLLAFLYVSALVQAQEPVSIELSKKSELPDIEFYNIIEDHEGFIWLCANKGLFRYDGIHFKSYNHTEQRGLSMFNVQEDTSHRIWCNNISGQFFYIKDNQIHLFLDFKEYLNGELAEFIIKNDSLWIFSIYAIYQVNLKTKKIIKRHSSKNTYGSPFILDNNTYIGTTDSILSINKTNNISPLLKIKLPNKNKKGNTITSGKSIIFKVGNSYLYSQIRNKKNTFFNINFSKELLTPINDFSNLEKVKLYHNFEWNNETWIATDRGVWVYQQKNTSFQLKQRFLKNKHVTKIIKDKDNNFWLTTLNNGIYIIPNINIEQCNIPIEEKNIKTIDKINDSTLIMGSNRGNIVFYNTNTHISTTYNLPPNEGKISKLKYHQQKQKFYISKGFRNYILDYKSLQIEKTNFFDNAKSFSILENNDLLYTNHSKVILLKNADYYGKERLISKNKRTYSSFYDKEKKEVYIAFVDELVIFDKLWNKNVITYNNHPIYAKSITKTANGIIWVASFKNGIYGIKNHKVVHHFTSSNGLNSNVVTKIKASNNDLWIVTDNSIQKLNVLDKKFQTLTKQDGVISYNITGIVFINNKAFFSSNKGLFSIDVNKSFKHQYPEVYFNKIAVNNKDTILASHYTLKHNQNTLSIGFNVNGFSFNQKGIYKYRLLGLTNDWTYTSLGENDLKYNSLPYGKYTFQIQPILDKSNNTSEIKELSFLIKTPFWKTPWFIFLIAGCIIGSVVLYFIRKIKIKEKEKTAQLEKLSLEKELIAINLTALRSQMNPHFIFNALNSIQDLVLQQDTDASYDYIVLFAKLIRNTLNYSSKDFISLEKELDFLNIYLQLEKLRFGEDFSFDLSHNCEETIAVPSLLIQPFIENSLVHGLLHKEGKKKLSVQFILENNILNCIVIDNGVGRVKSNQINERQGNKHESFALKSIRKRLEIYQKQYPSKIGYTIQDLYKDNLPIGTKVIVTMPFKKMY